MMSRKCWKRHALERHCRSGCFYVVEAGIHFKKEHSSWSILLCIFGQCEIIQLRPIDEAIYWIWWIFSLIIQELKWEDTVICCRTHCRGLGKSSEHFWGVPRPSWCRKALLGKAVSLCAGLETLQPCVASWGLEGPYRHWQQNFFPFILLRWFLMGHTEEQGIVVRMHHKAGIHICKVI